MMCCLQYDVMYMYVCMQTTESGAEEAIAALEKLREEYQKELGDEVNELEGEAQQAIKSEIQKIEKEIYDIEKGISKSLSPKTWQGAQSSTLDKLQDKLVY
jgi:F0F1-type ATP synthase membrane subunit b/b'